MTSDRDCPQCNSETHVTDIRDTNGPVRRRRECKACGYRFTTYESREKANHMDSLCKEIEGVEDLLRRIRTGLQ